MYDIRRMSCRPIIEDGGEDAEETISGEGEEAHQETGGGEPGANKLAV